jgi:hypothetical protein
VRPSFYGYYGGDSVEEREEAWEEGFDSKGIAISSATLRVSLLSISAMGASFPSQRPESKSSAPIFMVFVAEQIARLPC